MGPFKARIIAYLALGLSLALAALVCWAAEHAPGTVALPAGLALAALGLVAGVWVIIKGYVSRRGFVVTPRWGVVFADVMFTLASGAMSFGLLEYCLAGWLAAPPLLEEAVQVVMSWMLVPTTAFMAFFAANMASQSLEVNQEGLTWHGPGESRFLPWEQVRGLDLHETYVAVSRVGMAMPRRLQTKLVIKGMEDNLQLYEPGLKRTKREIVAALQHHGPPRLRSDLERIALDW
ncbi:MAG: hypothetical protein K9K65_05270 [Desulfarculaceae bacterium]|nr:hypothetical protein [Desulfarculaceae bacterium]MCF8046985.1 hypothetical protein [Desulfarculaceae bacterium]MCF8063606.1 hypothetical protein [Desulfarculaceae bacterium]MCF8097233.1 hypothetical protein [Desulfarculaceae bacterium]